MHDTTTLPVTTHYHRDVPRLRQEAWRRHFRVWPCAFFTTVLPIPPGCYRYHTVDVDYCWRALIHLCRGSAAALRATTARLPLPV